MDRGIFILVIWMGSGTMLSKRIQYILLINSLMLSGSFLEPMKLDRVILSTDANPDYIQFWPVVAKAWKKLTGVRPTLALIADANVQIDESLGDVIRFEPIPGVPTSMYAQAVRLLLPALFPDDTCIVSDIDMLPMTRSYFVDLIKNVPDTHFVIYRDRAYPPKFVQYPMCYVAAKGRVFGEVFHITSRDEIPTIICAWKELGYGWNTDELVMYQYLSRWSGFLNRTARFGHTGVQRLDRSRWHMNDHLISSGHYTEAHMPRPYARYKNSIDRIITLLDL